MKIKAVIFDPGSVGDHSPALIIGEKVEQVTTLSIQVFALIVSYSRFIVWSVGAQVSQCFGSMGWINASCYICYGSLHGLETFLLSLDPKFKIQ